MKGNMVQYAVLPNCTNNCKFCLCRDKRILSTDQIIKRINDIDENITYIDWKNKFYQPSTVRPLPSGRGYKVRCR